DSGILAPNRPAASLKAATTTEDSRALIKRGGGTGPTKPGNPRSRGRPADGEAGANSDRMRPPSWKRRSDGRPRKGLSRGPCLLPASQSAPAPQSTIPPALLDRDERKATQRQCAPSTIRITRFG